MLSWDWNDSVNTNSTLNVSSMAKYLFLLESIYWYCNLVHFLATNSFLSNVLAYGASQKYLIAGFQHNLSSAGYKPRIHGWDGLQGSWDHGLDAWWSLHSHMQTSKGALANWPHWTWITFSSTTNLNFLCFNEGLHLQVLWSVSSVMFFLDLTIGWVKYVLHRISWTQMNHYTNCPVSMC